jgi:two-component system, sensor histidine kinase YesM
MRERFGTIRMILFSTYSLIIVVVFAVLVICFSVWASELLKKNALDSLESTGRSIQEQLDSEIQKMNSVSLNVMYSNLVKNRFQRYLAYSEGKKDDGDGSVYSPIGALENAKELTEILTAVIGPTRPVEQIYLYDFESKVYGSGFDNTERTYRPSEQQWFQRVVDQQGAKYISSPVPDEAMSKFSSSHEKQYSLSLYRLFYDSFHAPMGIIEVKQYFSRVFKSVTDFALQNPYEAQILIYNDEGQMLYPLQADPSHYEAYIQPDGTTLKQAAFLHPNTRKKELVSAHYSEFTGWSTVIIVSEEQLFAPLIQFTKQTLLIAFLIMLFAIILSYFAAKRITRPILKIHRTIQNMRLEDLTEDHGAYRVLNSGLSELDQLHWSFVKMSARLKESMDELLLSQSQELQSKLIALQSQMNPHFLYNTLATIHVMAEEQMNDQIIAMSENMSGFLRYISSDVSMVAMEEEILYTIKFLDVNQLRFGSKLQYSCAVDPRLLPLRIPKLVIQPLVENALKYATTKEPPWRIDITGTAADGRWIVEVSDNGPGFTEACIGQLHAKIQEYEETGVFPILKLEGMGLLNLYIRLKLTYGRNMTFHIRTLPQGGASIQIGGSIAQNGG